MFRPVALFVRLLQPVKLLRAKKSKDKELNNGGCAGKKYGIYWRARERSYAEK